MQKIIFLAIVLIVLISYTNCSLNHYELLGISQNADLKQISKAFKVLSVEFHPDKDEDNEVFYKQIVSAYEVLRDKDKRNEYDNYLRQVQKELSAELFYDYVQNSEDAWVIKFYIPWCQPCQQMQPEWDKLAHALDGIVKVGSVDMSKHGRIGEHFHKLVEYYPTVLFFGVDKGSPIKYLRDTFIADRLLEFVIQQGRRMALSRFKTRQDEDVIMINDRNFDELVMQSDDVWFIDFDAQWCGSCQSMWGEWNTLATFRKDQYKVGRVEGPQNRKLRQMFKIQIYPTIILFPKGKKDPSIYITYEGNKDLDSFNEQLERYSNEDNVVQLSDKNYDQQVIQSEEAWIISFCYEEDNKCKKLELVWNSISEKFKNNNLKFGKVNIATAKDIADRYNVTNYPQILFFEKNMKFDNLVQRYLYGSFDETPLSNWIKGFSDEYVHTLNEYTFDKLVWNTNDAWFINFYVPWADRHLQIQPTLNQLGKAMQGRVKLGKIDASVDSTFVQRFKLTNFPSLLYFSEGSKDDLKIKTHIGDDFQLPTLERWLLGQDDTNVLELSDEEFQQKVMDSDETWFIQFYIPFDDNCKKFQPEWNLLAKELKNEPIHVAKMNCWTEGVICGKLRLEGHPNMHFFPPGSKAGYVIKKYDMWDKDTYSMLRWVREMRRRSLMEQGRSM